MNPEKMGPQQLWRCVRIAWAAFGAITHRLAEQAA